MLYYNFLGILLNCLLILANIHEMMDLNKYPNQFNLANVFHINIQGLRKMYLSTTSNIKTHFFPSNLLATKNRSYQNLF